MRTFAIWFFGLVGSAVVGAIVGPLFDHSRFSDGDYGVFGALAAMCAFACVKLWTKAPSG